MAARRVRRRIPRSRGRSVPRVLGLEDGERPLLVLEDLLARCALAAAVASGRRRRGARCAPRGRRDEAAGAAASVSRRSRSAAGRRWRAIRSPFSGSVSSSQAWLEAASAGASRRLGRRRRSTAASLVHCDVRSDNLCLRDGRAVLFDWSDARIAATRASTSRSGSRVSLSRAARTRTVSASMPLRSIVAGFFAALAGLPPPDRSAARTRLSARAARGCAPVGVPSAGTGTDLMLAAAGVSKSHGAEVVLAGVDLVVPPRARIGLVGPNGAGKSTLLRLLAGVDTPDRGVVADRRRGGLSAAGARSARGRDAARVSRAACRHRRARAADGRARRAPWRRAGTGTRVHRGARRLPCARRRRPRSARTAGARRARARRRARPAARCALRRRGSTRRARLDPAQPVRRAPARRADERSRLRRARAARVVSRRVSTARS